MRLTISNNLTPLLFGVLSGMFAMSAWGATEVRDTKGDIRLTMDGSPYVLVSSLYISAYDADDSNLCAPAQETLTVEPGVVLDLKGHDINVNGGALYIDGATLIGVSSYSDIDLRERTACGETFQGRATIIASTLQDLDIHAYDGAALTISHSVLRDTSSSSSSSRVVYLTDKSTATLMNNEVDSRVYLNEESTATLMNNVLNSRVYLNGGTHTIEGNLIAQRAFFISSLADRDRSLGMVDGVDRYVLDGSIYLSAYNRGGDGDLCAPAQETLTVEPGVVLDLKGHDINVNGGALYIDGATLIGVSAYSDIDLRERTACGETFQGRATITASTLQDLDIHAYDGAALTISHSVLRDTSSSSSSSRVVYLTDKSTATLMNNEVDSRVYLNEESTATLMNNVLNSRVYLNGGTHTIEGNLIAQRAFFISSLADRDRSLGMVDGVDRYVLDGSIYLSAYNRGGDGDLCAPAQETLTVEPGVVLDLKGHDINVNGGALYIDGATLIGVSAYSDIDLRERTACGETFQGRATITASTLQDLDIHANDGAALTISHSVLRNTSSSSSSSRRLFARDDSIVTITNSDFLGPSGTVIESTSSQVVVATSNYWGCSTGPNTEGCAGYTGNVQDANWVDAVISGAFTSRSISFELVDIRAFAAGSPLGPLRLALPVEVPPAATKLEIKFRVLDEAGLALPNQAFKVGMENGLLRASEGLERSSDGDGFLLVPVKISPHFRETASQVAIVLYREGGRPLAHFVSFFTTLETANAMPLGAVLAAEDVFTPKQLEAVEAALAASPLGIIDFGDLPSILPRERARRGVSSRVAGAISGELSRTFRTYGDTAAGAYNAGRGVIELIFPPAQMQRLHDEGMKPSVVMTPEDWGQVSTFLADNSVEIWNGTKCVVLGLSTAGAVAGTAASQGLATPAAVYLGSKTVVACAGFAVGVAARIARHVIEHAYCDGALTAAEYEKAIDTLEYADELSSIINLVSTVSGDLGPLFLGITKDKLGSEPSTGCDGVVTDAYTERSADGAAMVVSYKAADDGTVLGTVAVPLSGEVVDSINRLTYGGFGVLPRLGGLFENDDFDCALSFGANGGSWRAATYLDIHDYVDRGGDFGALSTFIRRQAGLSAFADRLCREEAMEEGDVFADRLSRSGGWLGPSLTVVPAGTSGTGAGTSALEHSIAIGRHEVTFADYDRYARATDVSFPDDEGRGRGARPVVNVSGEEAAAYARWLSEETGKVYRLATAAEWEYAASAGGRACEGCGPGRHRRSGFGWQASSQPLGAARLPRQRERVAAGLRGRNVSFRGARHCDPGGSGLPIEDDPGRVLPRPSRLAARGGGSDAVDRPGCRSRIPRGSGTHGILRRGGRGGQWRYGCGPVHPGC